MPEKIEDQGGKERWEGPFRKLYRKYHVGYETGYGEHEGKFIAFIRQVEQEAYERGRVDGKKEPQTKRVSQHDGNRVYHEWCPHGTYNPKGCGSCKQIRNDIAAAYSRGLSDMAAAGREAIEKAFECSCKHGTPGWQCWHRDGKDIALKREWYQRLVARTHDALLAAHDQAAKNLTEKV